MRKLLGIVGGIVLAGLAGWTAMADYYSSANVAAAADFPLNRAGSAQQFLDGGINPLDDAGSRELALDAISAAPMTSEATTWLAFESEGERQLALLKLAGSLGWHGEYAQSRAYAAAMERKDYARAMVHAEALLRRGRARERLAQDFMESGDDPAFRSALANALTEDADWSNGLIASESGADLPQAVLQQVFEQRREAGTPFQRQFAAPLISRLAELGQHRFALRLSALMEGGEPGRLLPGWPDAAAEEQGTPYDWRLFEGHSSLPAETGDQYELSRNDVPGARPAQVLLALTPGRYRLSTPGRQGDVLRGWRWGLACGGTTARPTRSFGENAAFSVSADCPVQMLSVAGDLALARSGTLPSLDLTRVE